MGGMVFAKELWHYWKPRKVGVYGPTMVGKTTLDRYMTTPGEMKKYLWMKELSILEFPV